MVQCVNRYVQLLYLKILHANFLRAEADQTDFIDTSKSFLEQVNDVDLRNMLLSGWRDALTAGWIIALGRFDQHVDALRSNLIPSRTCYAGQSHMVALARIGSATAREVLVQYLETYLPVDSQEFDQKWAYGALAWSDARNATSISNKFLDPELWRICSHGRVIGSMSPTQGIQTVERVMDFIDAHFPD